MKTQDELKRQLRQIDRKGYKAYKTLEGSTGSEAICFALTMCRAIPSPLLPECACGTKTGFRKNTLRAVTGRRRRRITFCAGCTEISAAEAKSEEVRKERADYRLPGGSGDSGAYAVLLTPGTIEARLEIGFPAYGRTIAAGELEEILFVSLRKSPERLFPLMRE